jgi:hypothetical protein
MASSVSSPEAFTHKSQSEQSHQENRQQRQRARLPPPLPPQPAQTPVPRRRARKSGTDVQWVFGENPHKDVVIQKEKRLDLVDIAWFTKVKEYAEAIGNTGKESHFVKVLE